MICPACGKFNEDGANFCRNCGTVLQNENSTNPTESQITESNQASEHRLPEGTTVLTPDMLPYSSSYNRDIPNQNMPNQGMPNQGMPNQGMPNQNMPIQGNPYSNYANYGNQSFVGGPVYRCATNRAWWKMLLLGLITFGIYDICIWCKMSSDINIVASRYDGRRTMHYFEMSYLAPFTLGIYMFVWFHQFSNRLGDELGRRGIGYYISAKDFWLWSILGSLILVGPFVYLHKVCKAVNLINEHYNING